jgi:TolC family type I secretion outer membrane protein
MRYSLTAGVCLTVASIGAGLGAGAAMAQDLSAPRGIISIPQPEGPAPRSVLTPQLPPGTPDAMAEADPAVPITTFVETLQRAYWTNPALLAERARLRGADYRLPQARAAYGPKLNYQASYGWQRDNFEQPLGGYRAYSGWGSTASAILTLPVMTFGRNAAGETSARAQIEFERATVRFTEAQTLLDAIVAYTSVLRDRAGVDIAADNLALLTRELSDNQARFKAREVTSTDLQQVETRVEQGKAQLLTAQRRAASSEADYLKVVGAPAGRLAPPNPLVLPANTLEDAYAYAQLHSAVIRGAFAREKISRAQKDLARANLMPQIELRGNADYGKTTPYNGNVFQSELRGQVVISGPIFESGLRRARLDEAEAVNDADWRLIDSAERSNKAEVADAWNEWLAQRAAIDRLKASMVSAQAAYDGALLQERAGLRTTLDVLDLARELLNARSGFNAASADAYVAQARIMMALGALELPYLLPDVSTYDPGAHFAKVRNNGDVRLLTPLLRGVDGIFGGNGTADRPLRDPATSVGTRGIDVPVPTSGK